MNLPNRFREKILALRDQSMVLYAQAKPQLADRQLRARWLADAAAPVSTLLAVMLIVGVFLMPDVIETIADWLTPDTRAKRLFGLSSVLRPSPLQPWVEGLLWLMYGAGTLYVSGWLAWQRRPYADDAGQTQINPASGTVSAPPGTSSADPRYRIDSELGRGAMGIVYRAEDTLLRRVVALKALAPHVSHDPSLRARFLREAQAVARLNHRGIVQIYDLVDGTNGCHIAMEFVRGPSLAELAGRQPQSIADTLRWGREIADALACAHEQHVIHRDLKPANVLMAEATQPKITDFGLARFTDTVSSETQIGTVMGSPAYMSPEQAAGHSTDERSDTYAFGILLYELLNGRPPFTGDSSQVMAAQVTRPPDDIRTRRHDVPEALAALVMQLLAKAPAERPASMREVANRLAAITV